MARDKPAGPASDSQARLAEIMDVLAQLESKVRTEEPMDLDGIIDLINVVRVNLVASLSPHS
jgi:hypothetical protein